MQIPHCARNNKVPQWLKPHSLTRRYGTVLALLASRAEAWAYRAVPFKDEPQLIRRPEGLRCTMRGVIPSEARDLCVSHGQIACKECRDPSRAGARSG